MKKIKLIVDTDPGVDDATALMFALNEPRFDILLFAVQNGNIGLENSTRNLCHILDLLKKDYPVVKGYIERLGKSKEDAIDVHTEEGLGGYKPPKKTKHKPIEKDAADAMYEVLKKYPKEVIIVELGPHTNLANLLLKYPDAKDLIKGIVMESAAPFGILIDPDYCAFNIRVDAPAFQCTIDSKLPVLMSPSNVGRDILHLTEEEVERIKNYGDIGKFLFMTYQKYWEKNYPDRRIATNDVGALYYLLKPRLYKTKKAFVKVDTKKKIGKVVAEFDKHGQFSIVMDVKRKKLHKALEKRLKQLSHIKITDKTFLANLKKI